LSASLGTRTGFEAFQPLRWWERPSTENIAIKRSVRPRRKRKEAGRDQILVTEKVTPS